ncbi:MAG TPA: C39 family peptidase [Kofleriaceae bacterium]|jgi:hypothetical protein
MGRALLAVACASCLSPADAEPPHRLATVVIAGVPHVTQEPDFCGEACVAMWANHLGKTYDQDAVFAATGLDPVLGRGAYTPELVRAVQALGFRPTNVYTLVDADHPQAVLDRELAALHADLVRGVPSIVCMHYDDRPHTTEHFRLVVGYDADHDDIVYQEPAEDDGAYRHMSRSLFEKLWQLPSSTAGKRVLVRIPLVADPAGLAQPAPEHAGFTRAQYVQHVMALREKLAAAGLSRMAIRIEPPFVVAGDAGDAALARDARTVRWAADHLERDFFAVQPRQILDVYLFHGDAAYRRGVRALAHDPPDTPYGFYSRRDGGLFMDISTGGGTLVHEIVHPYVEADFPNAPAWLNEGLGSLFEQSAERDGHIVGLTNWRLAGLQHGLDTDDAPSFRALTALDDTAFYDDDRGVHYAEARYLLYYLQDKGVLRDFYRAARAGRAKDPTAYAALVATLAGLGERDMDAFRARWDKYVAALRFP